MNKQQSVQKNLLSLSKLREALFRKISSLSSNETEREKVFAWLACECFGDSYGLLNGTSCRICIRKLSIDGCEKVNNFLKTEGMKVTFDNNELADETTALKRCINHWEENEREQKMKNFSLFEYKESLEHNLFHEDHDFENYDQNDKEGSEENIFFNYYTEVKENIFSIHNKISNCKKQTNLDSLINPTVNPKEKFSLSKQENRLYQMLLYSVDELLIEYSTFTEEKIFNKSFLEKLEYILNSVIILKIIAHQLILEEKFQPPQEKQFLNLKNQLNSPLKVTDQKIENKEQSTTNSEIKKNKSFKHKNDIRSKGEVNQYRQNQEERNAEKKLKKIIREQQKQIQEQIQKQVQAKKNIEVLSKQKENLENATSEKIKGSVISLSKKIPEEKNNLSTDPLQNNSNISSERSKKKTLPKNKDNPPAITQSNTNYPKKNLPKHNQSRGKKKAKIQLQKAKAKEKLIKQTLELLEKITKKILPEEKNCAWKSKQDNPHILVGPILSSVTTHAIHTSKIDDHPYLLFLKNLLKVAEKPSLHWEVQMIKTQPCLRSVIHFDVNQLKFLKNLDRFREERGNFSHIFQNLYRSHMLCDNGSYEIVAENLFLFSKNKENLENFLIFSKKNLSTTCAIIVETKTGSCWYHGLSKIFPHANAIRSTYEEKNTPVQEQLNKKSDPYYLYIHDINIFLGNSISQDELKKKYKCDNNELRKNDQKELNRLNQLTAETEKLLRKAVNFPEH